MGIGSSRSSIRSQIGVVIPFPNDLLFIFSTFLLGVALLVEKPQTISLNNLLIFCKL